METEAPSDALDLLIDWAVSNGAFRRNKLGVRLKVLAAVLVASGVSYREAASLLGGLSYIAARDCHIKVQRLLPSEQREWRRLVALDETELMIAGRKAYLWVARDVDTGQTLSFRCSFTGSPEDSALFASSVLSRCSEKPMARMGKGESRPRALKNVEFYFQVERGTGVVQLLQRILRVGRR